MKYWFELFFKNYIDELVDQRFKENMIERYWEQKRNETARRLQKARERHKVDSPESYEKPAEKDHVVLSSADVRWEDAKSKVQAKTTSSSLKDKLKRLDNAK
jgi:hypothetical protein